MASLIKLCQTRALNLWLNLLVNSTGFLELNEQLLLLTTLRVMDRQNWLIRNWSNTFKFSPINTRTIGSYFAKFQYNNQVHSSTQHTPFLLDTGQNTWMGFESTQPCSHIESINEFKDRMKDTLEEAKAALVKSKDNMAHSYKWKQMPAPDY